MTQNKRIIGVTGNSGSGKGTVCGILRDMGGFCVDADKLAHQVMERGQPAYTEIVNVFGRDILSADGSVDRKILGEIVFLHPILRKTLEQIVHARVTLECLRLTAEAAQRPECLFIVWDAPLLAEAGMHKSCDTVFLVTAPFAVKLSRILGRDRITEERARLRLSNQPADGALYKTLTADIGESRVKIIENKGTLDDLIYKTRIALQVC